MTSIIPFPNIITVASGRKRRYSVDDLENLYAELLEYVDPSSILNAGCAEETGSDDDCDEEAVHDDHHRDADDDDDDRILHLRRRCRDDGKSRYLGQIRKLSHHRRSFYAGGTAVSAVHFIVSETACLWKQGIRLFRSGGSNLHFGSSCGGRRNGSGHSSTKNRLSGKKCDDTGETITSRDSIGYDENDDIDRKNSDPDVVEMEMHLRSRNLMERAFLVMAATRETTMTRNEWRARTASSSSAAAAAASSQMSITPSSTTKKCDLQRRNKQHVGGDRDNHTDRNRDLVIVTSMEDAIEVARKVEGRVVELIRGIGEVIVNSIAASVCQKAILALLVDVFRNQPGLRSPKKIKSSSRKAWTRQGEGAQPEQDDEILELDADEDEGHSLMEGVAWSPLVKAQILHTVSLLISGVRDASGLYCLLSQHAVNQLLGAMLPLNQWTDPALENMLRPYAHLLKQLALQLGTSPSLFPLFLCSSDEDGAYQQDENRVRHVSFPLFTAILNAGISQQALSDAYVHITCLNLVVGLMQITHSSLRDWVRTQAIQEQHQLANHLCNLLLRRYYRLANLTTGPVVDAVRSRSIAGCLTVLDDHLAILNDVFRCDIPGMNVRLCETLLKGWIAVLLRNLTGNVSRAHHRPKSPPAVASSQPHFLVVGIMDADVIPQREARAQSACVVLSRLFESVAYPPFVRMVAVALLHERSIRDLWESRPSSEGRMDPNKGADEIQDDSDFKESEDSYRVMPALHRLVTQDESSSSSSEKHSVETSDAETNPLSNRAKPMGSATSHTSVAPPSKTDASHSSKEATPEDKNDIIQNPYRDELMQALRGEYGEWRVVSAAILLETVIRSGSLDDAILRALDLLPRVQSLDKGNVYVTSGLEQSIAHSLRRSHTCESQHVSIASLECVSSLAVHFVLKATNGFSLSMTNFSHGDDSLPGNTAIRGLRVARNYFYQKSLESQNALGISSLFVDLVETVVQDLYRRTSLPGPPIHGSPRFRGPRIFAYLLSLHGCKVHGSNPEMLVRKFRSVDIHDVEMTRFKVQMAFHFRAVERVLVNPFQVAESVMDRRDRSQNTRPSSSPMIGSKNVSKRVRLLDRAEVLSSIFGCLSEKPPCGSDLDLRGRMSFSFSSGHVNERQLLHQHGPWARNAQARLIRQQQDPLSRSNVFRSDAHFSLVLDPADMYIVSVHDDDDNKVFRRGTILCCIPLVDVLCAAADGRWLYIAINTHHDAAYEYVGFLIKNGNFPLCFESPGQCLIVQQYLDRCRRALCHKLLEKIQQLFSTGTKPDTSNGEN